MNECRGDPDRRAGTEYDPQRQVFVEANESHEEKQHARHNTEHGALGVFGHQIQITGIVQVQPDEHDQPRQGHHADKPGQRWPMATDRSA